MGIHNRIHRARTLVKEDRDQRDAQLEARQIWYTEWLQSDEWTFRTGGWWNEHAARGGRSECCLCGATNPKLDLHHLRHGRLGEESYEDLVLLDRGCHDALEDFIADRAPWTIALSAEQADLPDENTEPGRFLLEVFRFVTLERNE